jgi:hypothetical protein
VRSASHWAQARDSRAGPLSLATAATEGRFAPRATLRPRARSAAPLTVLSVSGADAVPPGRMPSGHPAQTRRPVRGSALESHDGRVSEQSVTCHQLPSPLAGSQWGRSPMPAGRRLHHRRRSSLSVATLPASGTAPSPGGSTLGCARASAAARTHPNAAARNQTSSGWFTSRAPTRTLPCLAPRRRPSKPSRAPTPGDVAPKPRAYALDGIRVGSVLVVEQRLRRRCGAGRPSSGGRTQPPSGPWCRNAAAMRRCAACRRASRAGRGRTSWLLRRRSPDSPGVPRRVRSRWR